MTRLRPVVLLAAGAALAASAVWAMPAPETAFLDRTIVRFAKILEEQGHPGRLRLGDCRLLPRDTAPPGIFREGLCVTAIDGRRLAHLVAMNRAAAVEHTATEWTALR